MTCTAGCGYCGRCTNVWDDEFDTEDIVDSPETQMESFDDNEDERARADADLAGRQDFIFV